MKKNLGSKNWMFPMPVLKKTVICVMIALASMSVFAEPYCGVEKLPNLIKCLPAPPEPGSADFARDVARYEWGKEQRKTPERAALARHDAVWSFSTVADAFSKPFGMEISSAKTPRIWKVLEDSLSTTDQMRVAPKAFYHRRRPFAYFNEEPLCPKEDGVWRNEGSYPSGHTMRSMVAALIFAEINPKRANEIFVRAMQYGENRVIAGAHWQSDVDMTQLAAAIAYSRLQTIPAFRAQMDLAKGEFAARAENCPNGFVTLAEAVPDAILEIRYYSTYNFVGERIDGYEQPCALLSKEAAKALKAASDDCVRRGYRLKIYDAYRPQRAVAHFVRWADDVDDTRMKAAFYPNLDKSVLFKQGYIAKRSGHSRGSTIDLTLFDMKTGKEVDMGGTFDWFGDESHPDYKRITEKQFANRMLLRDIMISHGFKPIAEEWWHFTLKDEPYPDTYFDFPVREQPMSE